MGDLASCRRYVKAVDDVLMPQLHDISLLAYCAGKQFVKVSRAQALGPAKLDRKCGHDRAVIRHVLRSAKYAPQKAIAAPRPSTASPATRPATVGTAFGAEAACPAPARNSTATAMRNCRSRC